MRVRFQASDGLIFQHRLKPPVMIDAGTLDEDDRRALEQMVKDARFFDLPARIPGSRDSRNTTCEITIEDGVRQHSISVCAPVQGPALRRLVDRLQELGTPQKV